MTDPPLTLADLQALPVTSLTVLASKPKKLAGLAELGITTVADLVTDYPRRYLDRTRQAQIRDLVPGDEAMVIAEVVRVSSRRTRGRPPKTLVTAEVGDGSGYLVTQQPVLSLRYQRGGEIMARVELTTKAGHSYVAEHRLMVRGGPGVIHLPFLVSSPRRR